MTSSFEGSDFSSRISRTTRSASLESKSNLGAHAAPVARGEPAINYVQEGASIKQKIGPGALLIAPTLLSGLPFPN